MKKPKKKIILCQNCHKREATVNWVGEGGVLDYVHGMYKKWCEVCSLNAQIKFAKRLSKKLPSLENKLRKELKRYEKDKVNREIL